MKLNKKKLEIVLARSGLSLTEIETRTGVSKKTIGKILKNKPETTRLSTANKLALGLNVDIEALV